MTRMILHIRLFCALDIGVDKIILVVLCVIYLVKVVYSFTSMKPFWFEVFQLLSS